MSLSHGHRTLLCGVAVVFALIVGSVTGLHMAAQAKTGKAVLGTWGVELTAMDKSIQPGDDFFRYAGGTWMKTTEIPADRARWGCVQHSRSQVRGRRSRGPGRGRQGQAG